MKKFILAAALAFLPVAAFAQAVQQSGSVTPNTIPAWNSNGVIKGGVTAVDSPVTNFGVTRDGADGICVASARQSAAGRNTLCLQASTSAAAKIVLQNYGTATAQDLQFVINGNTVTIPTGGVGFLQYTGSLTSGHLPCFSGTAGLVADCGVGVGAGTQYGVPIYSAAGTISSTAALTNGQIVVGQTGGNPTPRTLSGDVASVSSAGAVTLQSVNGVTYPSSYTANGVLYASSATVVTAVGTANVGYCLLSQGSSSPPNWASCASGAGSAGGANTQVQFNSSTALQGSANLTWVSPTLTIGVAGTTTGKLGMASDQGPSTTVTIQNPGNATAYNFNLPISAGSSGQPMISGGGGSNPMTFGTLGIVGGGTNCNAASGTCLDNITSFSSTGYINRTGAGTYAFSLTIPVSGGGTGLASGSSGGILYYSGTGTLASTATLTQYGLVYGGGLAGSPVATAAGTNGQIPVATTGAAPAFTTLSGDITTVSAAGLVTIANSAISNAKLANSAAYTLKGNFTGSSAAPQDSTMGALTNKASPAAGDYLLIADNAAAGALKYATVSSIASAGSVASLNSQTGAITMNGGITNSSTTFYQDPAYQGFATQNCTLAVSAAASALTIALKDNGGNDPSASSPCNVNFRNVTATTGSTSAVQASAATSLVISSGSTMGVTSSTGFNIWVVIFNDGGTLRLGAINASPYAAASQIIYPLNDGGIASSTAEGGAGGADSAGVFYTGTAVTAKAYRVLGYASWGASGLTAGTWTTSNLALIQMYGHGIKLPGERVQRTAAYNTSTTVTSSTSFVTGALTASISPTLAANLISVKIASSGTQTVAASGAIMVIGRGGCATTFGTISFVQDNSSSATLGALISNGTDKPNTTSSTAYNTCFRSNTGSSITGNGGGGDVLEIEEIQG